MQTIKISTSIKLVTIECYKCHIVFAMPKDKDRRARESGEDFYCPNGHPQIYETTENQRLSQRLLEAETDLRRQRERTDDVLLQLRAQKGHNTRLRKRIQAGVCPECNRHFENLERHMTTKHSMEKDT